MLVVQVVGRLSTRTSGAIVSMGALTFEPLTRRVRGKATEEPFGEGVEAVSVASGKGLIVVAPRGLRFTALALQRDILYLREEAVFAFEESLSWENGRIPGGGGVRVVQFRGAGRCVFRAPKQLVTVKLEAGETIYVDSATLVGWIGRVVPRQLRGEGGELAPYLECSGEGVLIVEEPPDPTPEPAPEPAPAAPT
jgi:uncharacterized protein (AIM24 family)